MYPRRTNWGRGGAVTVFAAAMLWLAVPVGSAAAVTDGSVVVGHAISITSGTTLARATIDHPYLEEVLATGGNPPYKWSRAKGSKLPKGLKVAPSGAVTGTPKALGTFTFTIQVVDTKSSTKPITQNVATQVETLEVTKNPDLNGDGVVNCADLAVLTSQYGQSGPDLAADLDGDGTVTGHDLSILLSAWTPGQPTTC
jgi:hypothetical protein